jgi:glyceraldehyde 3-phosphate dehydrogenase
MIRIGINGFGRIGRSVLRQALHDKRVKVVAINDLTDPKTLAHLLKYDSTHGVLNDSISIEGSDIVINSESIKIFSEPQPREIPWESLNVDVVLECTGRFTKKEDAFSHIIAGAKKVVISAPSPDAKTIVLGVNENTVEDNDYVISNASCTTNCLAPIAKIIDHHFGIEKGYITTTHAFTADQRLQDAPHKDLRRARSAMNAIIPTKTGAASAVGKVLPNLNGKLDGIALRVPVNCGSIVDLVCNVKEETTVEEVHAAIESSIKENNLEGIVSTCEDPIVSNDIVGTTESVIVDKALTSVNKKMIKLLLWYDNESAYSQRLIDLVESFSLSNSEVKVSSLLNEAN